MAVPGGATRNDRVTMFSVWIQRADFEARTWAVATAADVLATFESHDWAAELAYRDGLEQRGADSCAPGLGVEDDTRRTLHVCPRDAELADVHYHHEAWHRILGLLPVSRQVVSTLERLPCRELPALIEQFCSGDHARLARRFAAALARDGRSVGD